MKKSWLIVLLMGNVILLTTTLHWMGQFRKLKEMIYEEKSYTKLAAEKEYVFKPEHGLRLFQGKQEVDFLRIRSADGGLSSGNKEKSRTPWNTFYFNDRFGLVGGVDAKNFSLDMTERYGGSEQMTVCEKILVLLIKQLADQGDFLRANYRKLNNNGFFGYLSHPAGHMVLIVTPSQKEDLYGVYSASQFRDRPSIGKGSVTIQNGFVPEWNLSIKK